MESRKRGRKVALLVGLALVVLSVAMVWTYWGEIRFSLTFELFTVRREDRNCSSVRLGSDRDRNCRRDPEGAGRPRTGVRGD